MVLVLGSRATARLLQGDHGKRAPRRWQAWRGEKTPPAGGSLFPVCGPSLPSAMPALAPASAPLAADFRAPGPAARAGWAAAMAAVVAASNWLVQYPINDWLTWGAFSYPIAFLVTDVCNRCHGPRHARLIALWGFAVGFALSWWLATARIAAASGTAFLVAQLLDVAIFNRLRRASWWKAPLLGSLAASVLDTAIFFSLAFHGTGVPWLPLALGDLAAKFLMAVLLLAPYRALVRRLLASPAPAT